nr:putative reverse transcriptase domain-containing protein [Tanacetum cinerariifolium]
MTKLTQKGVKFDWGDRLEAAFQLIKQKLCSAPILYLPKGNKDFVVYCDASHKGLDVVLIQKESNFLCIMQLEIHEENDTTHDLELGSVAFTLKIQRLSFHITIATSTQQDIYAAGSESRPPMLNKENYVPCSSRLLRYANSRPNGKLIHNSILNGPYVRKMIPKPGDVKRDITVTKTFYLQTDDELSDKELKQIEADDQAIQTILLGLPEDIYAAVDSCETAQEI